MRLNIEKTLPGLGRSSFTPTWNNKGLLTLIVCHNQLECQSSKKERTFFSKRGLTRFFGSETTDQKKIVDVQCQHIFFVDLVDRHRFLFFVYDILFDFHNFLCFLFWSISLISSISSISSIWPILCLVVNNLQIFAHFKPFCYRFLSVWSKIVDLLSIFLSVISIFLIFQFLSRNSIFSAWS